jgi:type I restriction enzyme M protein
MFEQTFKNIDDILHKDAGCGSELDYVEQTSWVLFLKYLDDLEKDKATAAELTGKTYTPIIDADFQWSVWAAPKDKDGKLDHHKALTGDDLADFVNIQLFPYLKKFKADAESADTIEYKIGEIFSELKNRIQSGYNLREVINRIDELRFRTHAEKHEMSHLYEDKIKNMGNAGRNGGEYYTPRPLITTIIKVVAPKIGDKIYDGACGSAGFLCEAFAYLKNNNQRNRDTAKANLLRQREKIVGLYYRYNEYDFARCGSTQYCAYQYPCRKPGRYTRKRPIRCSACQPTIWRKRKSRSATKLSYKNRRNCQFVYAAFY